MSDINGIGFPFRFGDAGGVLQAVGIDKISTNLAALVLTAMKERVIRKGVGTVGYQGVFRPGDDVSLDVIREFVREAIAKYEPRARVRSIESHTTEDGEGVKSFIDVAFVFRETGEVGTVSIPL